MLANGFDGGQANKDFGVEAVELHKCFGKKGREGHQVKHLNVLGAVLGGSRAATSAALVHAANCSHVGTVESLGMRALNDSLGIRTGAVTTLCPWRARTSFVPVDNGIYVIQVVDKFGHLTRVDNQERHGWLCTGWNFSFVDGGIVEVRCEFV